MDLHQQSLTAKPAEPFLKDAADRIFIPYILNQEIPESAASDLIQEINRIAAGEKAMTLHAFGMGMRALNMLGEKRPAAFCLREHDFTTEQAVAFIHERDWSRSWRASIEILHVCMVLFQRDDIDVDACFVALESRQLENGGWGAEPFHNQMGTAFHFIPMYRLCQREMPRLDSLCAEVLENEPHGQGFGPMDALYTLWYGVACDVLSEQRINLDAYEVILAQDINGDRHQYVAAAQLFSLLRALRSHDALQDAWSPHLWQF